MPLIEIEQGVSLSYEEFGAGTPLLLVAGLGGASSYWKPQIEAFSKAYRVILHDQRGTGASTHCRTDYSVEQMTADVVKMMDRIGVEKAYLLGHSAGAVIGQVMAVEYPDRLLGLVMYAGWITTDPFMRRIQEARKTLAVSAGATAYVKATPLFLYPHWYVNQNGKTLAEQDKPAADGLHPTDIAAARIDAILKFDRQSDLGRVRTPTLVLGVEDDVLTPAHYSRTIAREIPGAELTIMKRGGHAASVTCSEEFNSIVLDYLGRLDKKVLSSC
jgi:aminoacrylate hydrolase